MSAAVSEIAHVKSAFVESVMRAAHDCGSRGNLPTPSFFLMALLLVVFANPSGAQPITNLLQLTQSLEMRRQIKADVDLDVVVCAASRPKVGVLIVQDSTSVELLQVGDFGQVIEPGARLRLRHESCFLRKRDMGIQLSASPLVNNDGLHSVVPVAGVALLPAGRVPVTLEWFNYWNWSSLDVLHGPVSESPQQIASSNLWHAVVTASGETNFMPGLRAEVFDGTWESVPDFNTLKSVSASVVTNFDLRFRSRAERTGIRFSGFLDIPRDGRYRFVVLSDDGSLLFLGEPSIRIERLGQSAAPVADFGRLPGRNFENMEERRWTVVEGRVSFVSRLGEGVKFDLSTGSHVIPVRIADADHLDIGSLLNARVRVTGISRPVMTLDRAPVLGKFFAASAGDLAIIEPAPGRSESGSPITSVAHVQNLPIELARQSLPVRIRGVVTDSTKTSQEHWMSFQDDTRGIFVSLAAISNTTPAFGELWEVEGRSAAGHFAPVVVAEKVTRVGEGLLPAPAHPTWTELLNGSRDVQWAELKGLATDVRSNKLTLHLPEGRLDVDLEGMFEKGLRPYLKNVVRIRGVLYAVWDPVTREVQVGRVMVRNPTISIEVAAPADPFDAVVRTPRELLLFDAQASAFRPVKVRGQIIYADTGQLFLETDGTAMRLLPVEKPRVRPGDLVDAVGYPDIGRTQLLLREVLLRKTGNAPMPQPKNLEEAESLGNPNAARVRAEGKLLGRHDEQEEIVLELQSGSRLFLARTAKGGKNSASLRIGSRLALTGIYLSGSSSHQVAQPQSKSFELLLNSMSDVSVLSQPPWWTLPRLLAVLGIVLIFLAFTIIWNTQLRRLVEQRTGQLQREIRERERVERQVAIESERSRIARDLHDDLGSSLTEISVLASTGQLPHASPPEQSNLFQSIGRRARGLISALDVIVWAVDPEDNTLQSLADYLTGYANDFFSHTPISCRFKVPVSCPAITVEGRVRHDVLMAVKEALNNIVRHAKATEVEFRLAAQNGLLEIEIADNGKGIPSETTPGGHGLKNLSARLTNLGGQCLIEPRTGGGTVVRIKLPLTQLTGRVETESV